MKTIFSTKKIFGKQQEDLQKIARQHQLDALILYGSAAKNKLRSDSDCDLALYKRGGIKTEEYLKIIGEISLILKGKEADVKLLNGANSLFRFFVTNDGILLFGDPVLFAEMKAQAYTDYQDNQDLFRLTEKLNKNSVKALLKKYA